MSEKLNMLLETARYSDLSSFLRDRDNRAAVSEYILEESKVQAFWQNLNKGTGLRLIYKGVDLNQGVGDVVDVYKTVKTTPTGQGLPGDAKDTRQLAGSEDLIDFQFSRERVGVGVHRYAIAMKKIIDKKVMPANLTAYTMGALSRWWARQDDEDIFTTLFRDYPTYYAEVSTLSAGDELDRVLHLFGRGTYNDVSVIPETIFAGTAKTDVEPAASGGLMDTDTLTDTFIKRLNALAATWISMKPITMQDNRNFYGLITEQEDIDNFYANSTTLITTDIKDAFQGKGWDSPLYNRLLGEIFGIRFFQYSQFASQDSKNGIVADGNSDEKFFEGTPLNPQAMVLGYYVGTATTITGLRVWAGGDAGYTTRLKDDSADGTFHYLLLSRGARHLPYFSPAGSTTIGVNSYNKFAMTSTIAAYNYSHIADTKLCGRLQLGYGDDAATNFKVLYTGPIFVGTLKIGAQNESVNYIDTVYRIRIEGLARYNASNNYYDAVCDDTAFATAVTAFKASLGITTNLIEITSSYRTLAYLKQRRINVFNTVRSILFGGDLMYQAQAGGSETVNETRDYGAIEGIGMNAIIGKKLVTNARGTINSYAVVCWKRPEIA